MAQDKNYNYSGYVELPDNTKTPYQLKFTEQKGLLTGYSVVDPFGLDETKSTVVGKKESGVFLLNEIDVMSTRSVVSENEFCLLQMRLQLEEINGLRYLNGVFDGFYSDSVVCVSGNIVLIDSMSFVSPVVEEILSKQVIEEKEKVRVLSADKGLSFQTENKDLVLFVWDSGIIDGDEISVYCNGSIVLDRFATKKRKKKIRLTLKGGLNTIRVKAINEGAYSPNTTRIQLKGRSGLYDTVTFLQANEEALIRVKCLE